MVSAAPAVAALAHNAATAAPASRAAKRILRVILLLPLIGFGRGHRPRTEPLSLVGGVSSVRGGVWTRVRTFSPPSPDRFQARPETAATSASRRSGIARSSASPGQKSPNALRKEPRRRGALRTSPAGAAFDGRGLAQSYHRKGVDLVPHCLRAGNRHHVLR